MTTAMATPVSSVFSHPALFYRDTAAYEDGVGAFIRHAAVTGEPAFVAVPGPHVEVLRQTLADIADGIEFADMTRLGRNPGRILAALHDFADRHADRPVRIVGEPIWPSRTQAELLEATRHEALINAAFAARPATILCPYDVAALPDAVVADARRTHPVVIEDGGQLRSPAYTEPSVVCADCDLPLAEPDPSPAPFAYTVNHLAAARHHTAAWLHTTALSTARHADFVLAVSEATTNSVAHGGGGGTLRLWTTYDDVVAEICDAGYLRDPLAGRRRPPASSLAGGRGLWIMHQLCDLVEIRATPSGLTLRLHMSTQ